RKERPFSSWARDASDHQENDKDKPGGYAGRGRQDLPAMAPGPIDAGSTAGGYQGCVEFSRV
ncbi:MAG: hypothetical protein WAR02_05005, partial [Pseudolabrys sp.]